MMAKPLKLLVCGDVRGKFTPLFARINSIQKKAGQFDMVFCVGDFFGNDPDAESEWDKLRSGSIKAPIAMLVLGPNKPQHLKYFFDAGGCDLCENITYLGRHGSYTGSSGLHIVYLSGVEQSASSEAEKSTASCSFTASDVNELRQSLGADGKFQGVDLLLTSEWPQQVDKYGNTLEGLDTKSVGSALISQLALSLKPRYHFSALHGVSYERQPYRNHRVLQDATQHVTRFIALADVGNELKRKYLYAFNVVPLKHMESAELVKQPSDVTECPYKFNSQLFTATQPTDSKSSQFFYDQRCIDRGTTNLRGKRKSDGVKHDGTPFTKRQPQHAQPTGPCWFCLASPEVEKHLVVSVGSHCYIAMAKGGLTGDHVLILPIGHYQSTVSAPPEVLDELENYKAALRKCFKQSNKSVVFFERNYKTQHLQIQVVAIESNCPESDVKEAFMDCAQRQNIELGELPTYSDLKQIVPGGAPYFYAELPSGSKLYYRISKGFPLQFGREALAHQLVLNMPDRVDWKSCQVSKTQENEMVADFRKLFKSFDFTLE